MLSRRLTLPRRRKDDQTVALRGSKSRNKVSVGEPAEGSLRCIGALYCVVVYLYDIVNTYACLTICIQDFNILYQTIYLSKLFLKILMISYYDS